jgi:hypothetical protein
VRAAWRASSDPTVGQFRVSKSSDLRGLSLWISVLLPMAAGIRRVSLQECREMFARQRGDDMADLIIPYTWRGQSSVREYRLRCDHPELEMDPETTAFRERSITDIGSGSQQPCFLLGFQGHLLVMSQVAAIDHNILKSKFAPENNPTKPPPGM